MTLGMNTPNYTLLINLVTYGVEGQSAVRLSGIYDTPTKNLSRCEHRNRKSESCGRQGNHQILDSLPKNHMYFKYR